MMLFNQNGRLGVCLTFSVSSVVSCAQPCGQRGSNTVLFRYDQHNDETGQKWLQVFKLSDGFSGSCC